MTLKVKQHDDSWTVLDENGKCRFMTNDKREAREFVADHFDPTVSELLCALNDALNRAPEAERERVRSAVRNLRDEPHYKALLRAISDGAD